tara:strand:- start:1394 stop:1558 length:165 start_codon:yes stop_codon:yes gene_type:complete
MFKRKKIIPYKIKTKEEEEKDQEQEQEQEEETKTMERKETFNRQIPVSEAIKRI